MDNMVALEVPGLEKHASEDLELGKGLAMTDSEVAKHPMDNKLAIMVNHIIAVLLVLPSRVCFNYRNHFSDFKFHNSFMA